MTTARLEFVGLAVGAILLGLMTVRVGAEPAPSHADLIGAPVFAADGVAIGRVADVSTTGEDRIDAIRVRTGAALAFGERLVVIPQPAFMIRRGVVVLPDLKAEDVEAFPDASTESDTPANDER
jgi:hypothetical protein